MGTRKYCLTLDLKNDPNLIEEYETHHKHVWPETLRSFEEAGILSMEIYRWENRLFMILETGPDFSFADKAAMDLANERVQEWERLMETYQQRLPGTGQGEKWQLMKNMFQWSKIKG
jgi:L-rhamnose mutarotase